MLRAIATATRAADTTKDETISVYRSATGIRPSAEAPTSSERSGSSPVSVSELLGSASSGLPDTTRFRTYTYKPGLQPEYISRPSVGYAQDNFGRGLFGGTAIVLGDLLGNNRLALAGQINGRLSEAYAFGAYTNLASRLQYTIGAAQTPIFILDDYGEEPVGNGSARFIQSYDIKRYIVRQGFAIGMRPRNRFSRWEFGLNATNLSSSIQRIERLVDYVNGFASDFVTTSVTKGDSRSYLGPYAAYVSDNALFGYTSPISGRV